MVVLNAARCNPWLRQYYDRLRGAGKPGKVAVIAAMRKLLAAVWSVAAHRRPFVPHLPAIAGTASLVTNNDDGRSERRLMERSRSGGCEMRHAGVCNGRERRSLRGRASV